MKIENTTFDRSVEAFIKLSIRTRYSEGDVLYGQSSKWGVTGHIVFDGHPDLRRITADYRFRRPSVPQEFPISGNVEMRYDPEKQRVIYQPSVHRAACWCRARSGRGVCAWLGFYRSRVRFAHALKSLLRGLRPRAPGPFLLSGQKK